MTITSSGAKCDVCVDYILPIDPDELVHTFTLSISETVMHCDNKCKQALIDAGSDWKKLPDGPLRKAFEKADKEMEVQQNVKEE